MKKVRFRAFLTKKFKLLSSSQFYSKKIRLLFFSEASSTLIEIYELHLHNFLQKKHITMKESHKFKHIFISHGIASVLKFIILYSCFGNVVENSVEK